MLCMKITDVLNETWLFSPDRPDVDKNMAGRAERCVPISSENPPTGRRQVPVTN